MLMAIGNSLREVEAKRAVKLAEEKDSDEGHDSDDEEYEYESPGLIDDFESCSEEDAKGNPSSTADPKELYKRYLGDKNGECPELTCVFHF